MIPLGIHGSGHRTGTTTTTTTGTTTTTTTAAGGSIVHGRQINASNTGIAGVGLTAADLTTVNGDVTYSTNGQTIELKKFTGRVTLSGNNITLRKCLITTPGGQDTKALVNLGSNNLIEDVTILPSSSSLYMCIEQGGLNGTFRRIDASVSENILTNGNNGTTVDSCYFHGTSLVGNPGGHADVVENYGGTDMTIIRSKLMQTYGLGDAPINCAPYVNGDSADRFSILDCYLGGGNAHILVDKQPNDADVLGLIRYMKVLRCDFDGHTDNGRYNPFQDNDSRGIVYTAAAQAANPHAILWPTSGPDASHWVDCSDLTPNRTGQAVVYDYTKGQLAVGHGAELVIENTGPWALQGVAKGSETLANKTPGGSYWRFDNPDEFAPTGTYVYNNNTTNHGGVVPAGGMTIDGYSVPAGTRVVQFYNFTSGDFYAQGTSLKVLFRGCRFRWAVGCDGTGLFNDNGATASQQIMVHFCDIGLNTKDPTSGEGLMHLKFLGGANHRVLRNYMTNGSTFLQPGVSGTEIIENWIDEAIYTYGELGPSGAGDFLHLNGCSSEGGLQVLHILRNHILYPSPDGSTGGGLTAAGQTGYGTQPGQTGYGSGSAPGRKVPQTDCIALFTSNGTQWLSTDVQVRDNLIGGAGYCLYAESSAGQQTNLKITGNKVSTKWWTNGGQEGGPVSWGNGSPIVNGVNGCELSNNTWYDDYGTGGDGTTATADRQYPYGNGPRVGTTAI